MPQRRPTPSSHRGFSHPLLFAQHLCYRDGKFAVDNRQCVYICFLDLCILRELLVCQSGWPVQGCRIESRYAATWTPNPPYSPPPALSEGGHGCLTSLSIAVRRAFDPASISSALIKRAPPRSDQRTVVSRGTRWRELSNLCRESPCADPSPRRYRHYGQSRKP
jgi:hypothetical protein